MLKDPSREFQRRHIGDEEVHRRSKTSADRGIAAALMRSMLVEVRSDLLGNVLGQGWSTEAVRDDRPTKNGCNRIQDLHGECTEGLEAFRFPGHVVDRAASTRGLFPRVAAFEQVAVRKGRTAR